MQRRTLWMGGVGALAAAAGALVAWRRWQPGEPRSDAEAAFWTGRFEGPNGEVVTVRQFQGKPLLVNFWATWCPPCVDELPLLNHFHAVQSARGWQVLGLAVDQPSAVRNFLKKLPLSFPVGMAGLAGTELSRGLGNISGGLPYSVVFDASGKLVHQKIGKLTEKDLALWAELA
jgi:thiol-disulfide isomerase/thioredoxin